MIIEYKIKHHKSTLQGHIPCKVLLIYTYTIKRSKKPSTAFTYTCAIEVFLLYFYNHFPTFYKFGAPLLIFLALMVYVPADTNLSDFDVEKLMNVFVEPDGEEIEIVNKWF